MKLQHSKIQMNSVNSVRWMGLFCWNRVADNAAVALLRGGLF